jgi:D-erythritol 1-phosphate dehydrogenase
MQDNAIIDLLVIGGGVNGAGIARDAAGRGLKVVLCEKDDLAQGTSSRSGKLIHGGLRYLEYYEFRLVREALIEREVLLNAAPHIIWPMRFVLPHAPEQRPAWLVRLGLFLYDHLGGRKKLPPCRTLDLAHAPEGKSIKPAFRTAFEYSDCWVDDARLVVFNALDAQARGATVYTRTEATSARREAGLWHVELKSKDGTTRHLRAKAIANAAGPWVSRVIAGVAGQNSQRKVRLVKGSHIIVQKFWEGPQAYVLQNTDKRLIFVNPYEGDMALIGTTDIPFDGQPEEVAITEAEVDYLMAAVNRYSVRTLTRADVRHSYSGVRPLYDDNAENPSAVTRDYVFDVEGDPPLLSVFGGKITTYRKLAEHALQKLKPHFPEMGGNWTAKASLPGGDMPGSDFETFLAEQHTRYPWMPEKLLLHYARAYGTAMTRLVGNAKDLQSLGSHVAGQLYEAEIKYLMENEWAETAEDILFRRTKHGLHLTREQCESVADNIALNIAKEIAMDVGEVRLHGR